MPWPLDIQEVSARPVGAQVSTVLEGQRGLSLDTPSTQVNADHHLNFTLARGGCPVECRTTWDLPSHSIPPTQGRIPMKWPIGTKER